MIVETRESLEPQPESSAAGRPGGGKFVLGARSELWIAPPFVRADSRISRVVPGEGGGEEVERTSWQQLFDLEKRQVWAARGGGEYSRRDFRELEYEWENLTRAARLETLSWYLDAEGVEGGEPWPYWGDGAVRILEEGTAGQVVVSVAAPPGTEWRLTVSRRAAERPFETAWALLFVLTGLPLDAARGVASRLGGVPLTFTAHSLPEADGTTRRVTHRVIEWTREVKPLEFFAPPAAARERVEAAAARLAEAGAVLAAFRGGSAGTEPFSVLWLLFRLEELWRPELTGELERLWRRTADSLLQVELMRLLLRRSPGEGLRRVAGAATGEQASLATAAVEALVAERSSRALPVLLKVLRRRQEFTDLTPWAIVAWGLHHLRALAGNDPGELRRRLRTLREAAGEGADPVAVELDFWLRWWEEEGRAGAG